jgi:stage V sporulation protein B
MKQNIYKSAAQVTIFSTIEKAISFLYRIILSRKIGAEGLGIYQICLSVFAVFLTAASSGVPVTVTRLISKCEATGNQKGKHQAVTAGVIATLFVTIPTAIILFFSRNILNLLFSDERCKDIFVILLPGLILTSIYAVMRGAFWGNKQFLPYSIIELAEDSVMVILGCILIFNVTDPVIGARQATIAVLISYIFSFFVSVFWYLKTGGRFVNPKRQLKPLLSSSIPITAMRTSTSLLNSAVAVLLPLILMKTYNMTNSEAISLYGIAIGMSVPLLFMPSSLIGSISVVIAPELAENFYKGKEKTVKFDIEKSIKAAIFIAAILVPILFVTGEEIGEFLYSNDLSGDIVKNSSFILFPMCLSMITTTILNSLHSEKKTLLFFFFGAIAMLASIIFLTKYVGVYSYILGLAANFLICATLNICLLKKKVKGIKFFGYTIISLVSTIFSCAFGSILNGILKLYVSGLLRIIICAPLCLILSLTFLFCLDMFTLKPIKKLFAGTKKSKCGAVKP